MLEYENLIEVHIDYVNSEESDPLEEWTCEETELTSNALILHRASGKAGFPHTKVGIPLTSIRNWVERIPNT